MIQGNAQREEYLGDGHTAAKVFPMGAPGAYCDVSPRGGFEDCCVIFWADRVLGGPHLSGIRIAPGEYVGDAKGAVSERARAAFAAFDGGVILDFGRG